MWAVGCIVAEMFVGRPLLPGTRNEMDSAREGASSVSSHLLL